jgi:diacylglycerol O-acyltransferase / wax synthase
MSGQEALMWHLEKDPYLLSNFGAITILGKGFNFEHFRHRVQRAIVEVPRLRRRVLPSMGRLQTPRWAADREFDLDSHLYRLGLPGPGTQQQLVDLCSRLLNEPFDRTRPLWQMVIVEGLENGGTALFTKMHHTVSDGITSIRIAEHYMDMDADQADPGEIDYAAEFAKDAERDETQTTSPTAALAEAAGLAARGGGIVRTALGELALGVADPSLLVERGLDAVSDGRGLADQLRPSEESTGSTLWTSRSRRRVFHATSLPQEAALAAARQRGGKLNDLFVTAVVEAAARYHEDARSDLELLNISFIVSTRKKGDHKSSNAFTPVKATAPAGPMSLDDRFKAIQVILEEKKTQVSGGGMMSQMAGPANLLPTSVLTKFARSQASGLDLATSNVRAAPFTVYIAGAKVLATYPMGPVAGTAGNVTLMSYDGTLDVGLNLDPAAVQEPQKLAAHFTQAVVDLSK